MNWGGRPKLAAKLEFFEKEGKTVVVLCSSESPLLTLAVADTVLETSTEAIAQLQQMGVSVSMLTSDNPYNAQSIANKDIIYEKVSRYYNSILASG